MATIVAFDGDRTVDTLTANPTCSCLVRLLSTAVSIVTGLNLEVVVRQIILDNFALNTVGLLLNLVVFDLSWLLLTCA